MTCSINIYVKKEPDLIDWLDTRRKENKRSRSAEILKILQEKKHEEEIGE